MSQDKSHNIKLNLEAANALAIDSYSVEIAAYFHAELSNGHYNENLNYVFSDDNKPFLRYDVALNGYPDDIASANNCLREGVLAAMQYPTKTFIEKNTNQYENAEKILGKKINVSEDNIKKYPPPKAIEASVLEAIDNIVPAQQTTQYSDDQISELSDYVRTVMTMPPILSKYQKRDITENNNELPVMMQIRPDESSFSSSRAMAFGGRNCCCWRKH